MGLYKTLTDIEAGANGRSSLGMHVASFPSPFEPVLGLGGPFLASTSSQFRKGAYATVAESIRAEFLVSR